MFTFFANDDADIKLRIGGDSSIFKVCNFLSFYYLIFKIL